MDEIELQEVLDLYNKIFLECPKVLEIHLINNSRIEECKQGLEIRKNKEKPIYLISNLNECKEKSEFHPDYYN